MRKFTRQMVFQLLIPIPISNETHEKELFLPIIEKLSEFMTCSICVPNNECWYNIVGLPDKTVAESRKRIRAALNSINLLLPPKRITVNLSPADLLKEGSHYDLAVLLDCLL